MIEKINEALAELMAMLPMDAEHKRKLDEKIRLEFNYNSNHLEGNTLTYGETQLLLMRGTVTGDHEKRELDEMEAHDVAFSMIRRWALDKERKLTEADIKTLNKVILVKPFYKEAITKDGQATRRLIKVGDYKEHPNSVLLANGEMHYYASPTDTPIKMQELVEWYHEAEQKGELHPIDLAAIFHHRFVSIHPFDDGNGRVARLLVNYMLLKADMPVVIIKSKEKSEYIRALAKADVGDIVAFVTYMQGQLLQGINLYLKAAKGESIVERDDWVKELEVISKKGQKAPAKRNMDTSLQRFQDSIFPMARAIIQASEKNIAPLFNSMTYDLITKRVSYRNALANADFELTKSAIDLMSARQEIRFTMSFKNYEHNGVSAFSIDVPYLFLLESYTMTFTSSGNKHLKIIKPIDEPFTKADIDDAVSAFGKLVTEDIKSRVR